MSVCVFGYLLTYKVLLLDFVARVFFFPFFLYFIMTLTMYIFLFLFYKRICVRVYLCTRYTFSRFTATQLSLLFVFLYVYVYWITWPLLFYFSFLIFSQAHNLPVSVCYEYIYIYAYRLFEIGTAFICIRYTQTRA